MPSRLIALCTKGCGAPRVHPTGRYCAYHREQAFAAQREANKLRLRARHARAKAEATPESLLCRRCGERERLSPRGRYCAPCKGAVLEEHRLKGLEYHKRYWAEHGAERLAAARAKDEATRAWRTEKFCADCKINLVGFKKRFCAECIKAHIRAHWQRVKAEKRKGPTACAWEEGCAEMLPALARSRFCPVHRAMKRRASQVRYAERNREQRRAYGQAYQAARRAAVA